MTSRGYPVRGTSWVSATDGLYLHERLVKRIGLENQLVNGRRLDQRHSNLEQAPFESQDGKVFPDPLAILHAATRHVAGHVAAMSLDFSLMRECR